MATPTMRSVILRLENARFQRTFQHGLRAECQFTMISKAPAGLESWNGRHTLDGTFAQMVLDGKKGGTYACTLDVMPIGANRQEILISDIQAI